MGIGSGSDFEAGRESLSRFRLQDYRTALFDLEKWLAKFYRIAVLDEYRNHFTGHLRWKFR